MTYNYKHGCARQGKKTSEYYTWVEMRQRCNNPNNSRYEDYGGRGIKVCERWDSFENFFVDMGIRPKSLTLDRIDNDGDYCPENCRWTTYKVNGNNKRVPKNARLITVFGKTQTLFAWSKEVGISYQLIDFRLKSGWSVERALMLSIRQLQMRKRRELKNTAPEASLTRRSLLK